MVRPARKGVNMSKMDVQILVVPREKLLGEEHFTGFKAAHEFNYEERILKHVHPMRRGDAEENPSFKQPICYVLLVNPKTKKVFTFQRTPVSGDPRLHGKWSWGMGGHVEPCDTGNPLQASMLRELREEVVLTPTSNPRALGYINYEDSPISQVHFGMLYVVETHSDVHLKEAEHREGTFRDIAELKHLCATADVEDWSRIALAQVERYLETRP